MYFCLDTTWLFNTGSALDPLKGGFYREFCGVFLKILYEGEIQIVRYVWGLFVLHCHLETLYKECDFQLNQTVVIDSFFLAYILCLVC